MTKDQYICRRAANAILSEMGPYQISSDALQTINQFLDQILALLLQNTQSLKLARVKSHLLALLPLSLGKNALVEAELEVKTYYSDTNKNHSPLYVDDESSNEPLTPLPFPLDQVWTSLRHHCIEHSTLTDKTPDSPTVRNNNGNGNDDRLQQDMVLSPVVIIYFTAVLEHIAEYILTIIAMTAEQQDAKYIRIKEVYSALLNDGQVGGLFKQTDLRLKLEKRVLSYQAQQQQYPYQQPIHLPSPSPSPATSFKNQVSVTGNSGYQASELYYDHDQDDDDLHSDSPPLSSRTSSSIKSGQSSSSHYRPVSILSNMTFSSNRSSSSTSKRTFRFFGKKEKRPSTPIPIHHHHHRTKSPPPPQEQQLPPSSSSVQTHESNAPALDFEDLMRSGNTIKVSLTPNRLRSIEVKSSSSTQQHQHQHQPNKTGHLNNTPVLSSPPSSSTTPVVSSPTLSHPTPLRVLPPNGTPFENPRAAPKPPIAHYQPKNSFETPPMTPDSSIGSRLSTMRSSSPSFEEEQQQRTATPANTRHTKQNSLTPLQLAGRARQCHHRKQESVDTLSTDVCAMDLPSPPSTMEHHPSSTMFANDQVQTSNNKHMYTRPSSMVAKRAAASSGMARPASCHENFGMTMGQNGRDWMDSRPTSPTLRSVSPTLSDPVRTILRQRTIITRPSSPAIVEEDEGEDDERRMDQPTALDAGAKVVVGVSLRDNDNMTTASSRNTMMMVNSSMQTDPLPGLPPLASLLPSAAAAAAPPLPTSISIPTLIVTTDDPPAPPPADDRTMMMMRHIGNGQGLDDDDEEEWFLEDDDWDDDDVQDQDSMMAEWLLGET